jgi:hypothetical protein
MLCCVVLPHSGSIAERVVKGVANFSALTAHCAPGDSVNIVISVESLPTENLNYHAAFSTEVTFSFRKCYRGEILERGFCDVCPLGYYTFDAYDSMGCLACPEHAFCPGGAVIEVDEGRVYDEVIIRYYA